jgi:hypothetical protein
VWHEVGRDQRFSTPPVSRFGGERVSEARGRHLSLCAVDVRADATVANVPWRPPEAPGNRRDGFYRSFREASRNRIGVSASVVTERPDARFGTDELVETRA